MSVQVENDCEDQGYSDLADGCTVFACQEWQGEFRLRPTLQAKGGWWICPKCGGSYGAVKQDEEVKP